LRVLLSFVSTAYFSIWYQNPQKHIYFRWSNTAASTSNLPLLRN
jgi:hypothetical protein